MKAARVALAPILNTAKIAVAVVSIAGAIIWGLYVLAGVAIEFFMVGSPTGTPLTHVLRTLRFDMIGRFVVVSFFTWMYYHIVLRPRDVEAFTGYDLIFVALGVGIACITGKLWYLGGVSR